MQTTNQLMEQVHYLNAIGNYEAIISIITDDMIAMYAGSNLHIVKSRAYYNLGKCYDEMNMHHEAIAAYKKSLELDPAYDNAYYNIAATYYYDMEQYCEALAAYQQYMKLTRDNNDDRFRRVAMANMNHIQKVTNVPLQGTAVLCDDHICQLLPPPGYEMYSIDQYI